MTAQMTAGRKLALSALLGCALLAWGTPQASAAVPTLITTSGSAVTATTATLNGTVNTDSTLTDCHFEYVTPAAYRATGFTDLSSGGSAPCVPAAASIPLSTLTPVSAAIARPAPDPALLFRLVAVNASGAATGLVEGVGFGITSFDGTTLQESGEPATQAGSRPFSASTSFFLSTALTPTNREFPTEALRSAAADLPPGLIGNPQAVGTCAPLELQTGEGLGCPDKSQVGYVIVWGNGTFGTPGNPRPFYNPLYKMKAPKGTAAEFVFNFGGATVHLAAKLRTGGDYGVTVGAEDAATVLPVAGVTARVWGVPADPSHDSERGLAGGPGSPSCADPATGPSCSHPSPDYPGNVKPFFTLPTSCLGPVKTSLNATSWEGSSATASFLSHDNTLPTPVPIGNDGCAALDFSPTLQARPTTNVADSPSGLDVDLHIPQNESCDPGPPVNCGTAEANLKDTTVTLPEGLVINPSGANGLDGCSPAQIDLKGEGAASCPNASKLGNVEVDTPVLDHPVPGAVYIARPFDNPFNSLLAIYIAVDDPISGVVVKLAGEVHADPVTGQLTTTFKENPQLPFEDFKLKFFGGAGGSLRTPPTCGTYATTSSLTPWSAPDSGPPATPSDTYAISQAPGGGSCATSPAAQPNAPSFDAGTVDPIAGAYSPLVVNLRREDGSQQFSTVTLTPPPGLVGKLAGTPPCPQSALEAASAKSGRAEEANPSCPAASEVGSVNVSAGAGPAPYYAKGKAYLSGPYKGAPLSLAIVTPATAGPFDLGTVVVRTALYVNPSSAQITAVSDPIPSILQGIPLDVRSAQVKLDKPNFTLNPTSCDPMTFGGQLLSTLNLAAPLSSPFQVGDCAALGFKPKLGLRLKGGNKRGAHPALRAVLTMPAGGANIAGASVALPHSEFLDQSHIRTICTRAQFAADQCPAAAIYGQARAFTPLLDQPLEGPVYLRSSSNLLPDLVAVLRGPDSQPIEVDLDGRIDSVHGGIRTSFESVPDAPVSEFVLEMQGGAKGLLVNSRDICKSVNRATVRMDGQNGKTHDFRSELKAGCGKKGKSKKAKKHGRHKRAFLPRQSVAR